MATQVVVPPVIRPANLPNGWVIIALKQVPPCMRNPEKATFIRAQNVLYIFQVDDSMETYRRVDLEVFVNHNVGLANFPLDHVLAANGARDWVRSDPNHPCRANQQIRDLEARRLVGIRSREGRRRLFDLFDAIIPQIMRQIGTSRNWANATVQQRESVLNAIYLTDEYSIASAILGSRLRKTVNLDAIFLNTTYSAPNTNNFNIIPLLRGWLRFVFLQGFEIRFQYSISTRVENDRLIANATWATLPQRYLVYYQNAEDNGNPLPANIMIPENMPIMM